MEPSFIPVYGIIQTITGVPGQCCQQMVSLITSNGVINMIITPTTYVVNNTRLRVGMRVAAFYDGNAPVPLIFPPQYRALVIAQKSQQENIILDTFNEDLSANHNSLKLNIGPSTQIMTSNGQRFDCDLGNQLLLVYYSQTTRSIPPQTTPRRIIVMC